MATLTLNLLIEEQLAREAEARDPVKITVAIGIGVLALTVAISVFIGQRADKKKSEAGTLKSRWETLQGMQASVAGSDTKALKTLADDFIAINQARPIYAEQLALVKDIIPDSIQLTELEIKLVTEVSEGRASAKAAAGEGEGTAKSRPTRKERLVLLLNGIATSIRPEIEVDQFIKSMREHPVVSTLVKEIRLRSIARTSGSPDTATIPSATFIIECAYKESK